MDPETHQGKYVTHRFQLSNAAIYLVSSSIFDSLERSCFTASLFWTLLFNTITFAFNLNLIVQECKSMCTFWPRNCKQKTTFSSEVIYMPIYCGVFPLPSQTHSSSGMPQSRVRVAWWPLTANTMLCQWLSARRIRLKVRRSFPIEPW